MERSEERAKALAPADAAEPARQAEADRVASPPAAVTSALGGAAAGGAVDQARQAPATAAFRARADATLVTVASPSGQWRCRVASGSAVEASSDGDNLERRRGSRPRWPCVVGGTSRRLRVLVGWLGGWCSLVRDGRAPAFGLGGRRPPPPGRGANASSSVAPMVAPGARATPAPWTRTSVPLRTA